MILTPSKTAFLQTSIEAIQQVPILLISVASAPKIILSTVGCETATIEFNNN